MARTIQKPNPRSGRARSRTPPPDTSNDEVTATCGSHLTAVTEHVDQASGSQTDGTQEARTRTKRSRDLKFRQRRATVWEASVIGLEGMDEWIGRSLRDETHRPGTNKQEDAGDTGDTGTFAERESFTDVGEAKYTYFIRLMAEDGCERCKRLAKSCRLPFDTRLSHTGRRQCLECEANCSLPSQSIRGVQFIGKIVTNLNVAVDELSQLLNVDDREDDGQSAGQDLDEDERIALNQVLEAARGDVKRWENLSVAYEALLRSANPGDSIRGRSSSLDTDI